MKVSENGLELIREYEGLRLQAYLCPAGVWTIGYGTTKIGRRNVKKGDAITKEQAEQLLRAQVDRDLETVKPHIKVELNQNQIDAIASFIYNVGTTSFIGSTFLRLINERAWKAAADQLIRVENGRNRGWIFARNKSGELVELAGLVRRRKAEKEMFLR